MEAKQIYEIIMKHMRINGSESCSTSEFESDVEDAANEIAAQQSVQADVCECVPKSLEPYREPLFCDRCGKSKRR